MNVHDATYRRTAYWLALLAGVALLGMQFSCVGPPSILAAPGFPRASRRIEPNQEEAMKWKLPREEASPEAKASMYWISPRPVPRPVSQVISLKVPPAGKANTQLAELSRPPAHGPNTPLFPPGAEPIE